jgi:hypothetical protein
MELGSPLGCLFAAFHRIMDTPERRKTTFSMMKKLKIA